MIDSFDALAPNVLAYLLGFKPKTIQGLYSFAHYENEQGDWIQVSEHTRSLIRFKRRREVEIYKFDSAAELCNYIDRRITEEENNA